MVFKKLHIENFRNFSELSLENLTEKNIIFGENDIGKTNLISALRFLFDWRVRSKQCLESDFHKKDITKNIKIQITLDLSKKNEDSQKIFSKIKGLLKEHETDLIIELVSIYSKELMLGEISLRWGASVDELEEIPQKSQRYEIDDIFNSIYIDSSIKLDEVFKKYVKRKILNSSAINDNELDKLRNNIHTLNEDIGTLTIVKTIEDDLSEEYEKYKSENMKVKIKSEIEVDNIYSKLNPYVEFEGKTYPTCGDGRKKIMEYSILTLLAKEEQERKINLFFIEEVENHLHRSVQLGISTQLFQENLFKYIFLSTHSSFLIKKIEDVTLIKLVSKGTIIGKTAHFKIPDKYQFLKNKIRGDLTEAIFAKKVLLVEGHSEKLLFDKVLSCINKNYESENKIILSVDGVDFKPYYDLLISLGIEVIVKTDNDITISKKSKNFEFGRYNLTGLDRCFKLIEKEQIGSLGFSSDEDKNNFDKTGCKVCHYDQYHSVLKGKKIYISRIDLEHDLTNALKDYEVEIKDELKCNSDITSFLQEAKVINLIEFIGVLNSDYCQKIYKSEEFRCLKDLCDDHE